MNIAVVTPYGHIYEKDRLFDPEVCKIGENLLIPGITLKKKFEQLGHQYHTADVYKTNEIEIYIFQDLNKNSILLLESMKDFASYVFKRKWKNDYLLRAKKNKGLVYNILIMQEPPVVCPQSYEKKYHKYFDRILTWDSRLVDDEKYFLFHYPQVKPFNKYNVQFKKKKFLTMICGNKISNGEYELYSKREEAINYFEKLQTEFDLYGVGWDKTKHPSYRGFVEKKLDTLSKYKFSICYENMCNVNGYITEKIFDCFFSGCVPIYWGAEDVTNYIPIKAFIDRRKFKNNDELYRYIISMEEKEYNEYIDAAGEYINSVEFRNTFSVDAYVRKIIKTVLK